jgi:hypothetical protein
MSTPFSDFFRTATATVENPSGVAPYDYQCRLANAAVNFAQVEANWLIGRQIVEQEQHGSAREEYGKQIIALASRELTKEFGRGFSEGSLRQFRQFYQMFPDAPIRRTAFAESAGLPLSDEQLLEMQRETNLADTVYQISEAHLGLEWRGSHLRLITSNNANQRNLKWPKQKQP